MGLGCGTDACCPLGNSAEVWRGDERSVALRAIRMRCGGGGVELLPCGQFGWGVVVVVWSCCPLGNSGGCGGGEGLLPCGQFGWV